MRLDPLVTTDLSLNPRPGSIQLIARVSGADRNKINLAAGALGLNQAQFLRTALVGVAEAVLRETAQAA